ncbi:MAG TPA: helix-turn-helix transcriptional regulator [Longimicrobiales bacterium]|nr:helix-turn-helix transcriptional regulator [Longimicrobiales bacterium]
MAHTIADRAADMVPLRPPVFEILLTLGEGARHGYGIIQALRDPAGAGLRIETGPLYRHLKRLFEAGLIEQSDEPPAGTSDDDRRTAYYALTPLGRAVVQAEALRLAGLVRQTRRLGLMPERVQ